MERIKSALHTKEYEDGMKEAEKALKKYPNNFDITYYSGLVYEIAGIEAKNPKDMRRALELLNKSCELIGQNTDTEISEISIQMQIAEILLGLGETEKAVSLLKQYNYGGTNNAMIGYVLSSFCQKAEEAMPYLSKALITNMTELLRITLGFLLAFWDKGDTEQALDILEWTLGTLRGLKTGKETSYLDKMEAFLLPIGAGLFAYREDEKGARAYMVKTYEMVQRFDASPCYTMEGIKYYCDDLEIAAADDMGNTAMESVENIIMQVRGKDENTGEMLWTIWKEIKSEKTNA